jgi:hypothetical protein
MTDAVRAAVEKTAAAVRQLEIDLNLTCWRGATTAEESSADHSVQKFAH